MRWRRGIQRIEIPVKQNAGRGARLMGVWWYSAGRGASNTYGMRIENPGRVLGYIIISMGPGGVEGGRAWLGCVSPISIRGCSLHRLCDVLFRRAVQQQYLCLVFGGVVLEDACMWLL